MPASSRLQALRHGRGAVRRWGFPGAVLVIGLVVTIAVTTYARRSLEAQNAERFAAVSDRLMDSIQGRVETYIGMLHAGTGLFAAATVDDPETFRSFARQIALPDRYPGVQGIGFTRRLRPADLAAVVRQQRRAGTRDFRVWPDYPRDEYHAILFLEPLDRRNQAAIGYDMFTDPVRRDAMERARDTGHAAASGRVTLVQEIDEDKQAGFLIYVPLYEGGDVPLTIAERRNRLLGFIYSPFRTGDLFAGILGRNPNQRASFDIFDGAASPDHLLYRTVGAIDPTPLTVTHTLAVAGRPWTVRFYSTPVLEVTSSVAVVPLIAWIGGILTLLLTGAAWLQTRSRQQAEASELAAEEASEALRTQTELLERESRLKDEFLATLSHELRTPLNAIIGWAHMLAGGRLPAGSHQRALETILRNARMQADLISELLDMSRILSGRTHIEMTRVDLREIVESALNTVRPTAGAKHLQLTLLADPGEWPVSGDSNRLHQVFWNLLTNAVKFTPAGGRVEVRLRREAHHFIVEVCDTGIGMTGDFLPHAFERFRQADGSRSRAHGGLGLGLSIVRSLVTMHAGTITAASRGPDLGSTFTVTLPAAAPVPVTTTAAGVPAQPAGDGEEAGGLRTTGDARDALLAGTRILLVDDDVDAREMAHAILAQHGARVSTASTGVEALQRVPEACDSLDLLICDIGMPGLDGYETIRRVRALPPARCRTLPAIALTAYVSPEDRERALLAGYTLHVAKPFAPDELVAACTTAITSTQGREQ